MDTDKLVFAIIGAITLLITGIIIATSFSTTSVSEVKVEEIVGSEPHRKGPESARLTIVEFSDFECPFCANYVGIINSLVAQYPEDLSFVYRHYPLPSHPNAMPSAKASEAAAKQGKFWEYHDEVFANQADLSLSMLDSIAESLGLNIEQFKADYSSADVASKVQEDADMGRKLNVPGTPTFYAIYDGKVEVVALQQIDDLEKKIAEILGESANTVIPVIPEEDPLTNPNPVPAEETELDPQLQLKIILDVVNEQKLADAAPSEVQLNSIEITEWPDASLGCPVDGQTYAQVVTPGYKVIGNAKDVVFEYHTDLSGENIVYCGQIGLSQ